MIELSSTEVDSPTSLDVVIALVTYNSDGSEETRYMELTPDGEYTQSAIEASTNSSRNLITRHLGVC